MAVGETVTAVPLVMLPTPLSTLPVPLLKTAVRVVDLPAVIVAAPGAKLVIDGAAAAGVSVDTPVEKRLLLLNESVFTPVT